MWRSRQAAVPGQQPTERLQLVNVQVSNVKQPESSLGNSCSDSSVLLKEDDAVGTCSSVTSAQPEVQLTELHDFWEPAMHRPDILAFVLSLFVAINYYKVKISFLLLPTMESWKTPVRSLNPRLLWEDQNSQYNQKILSLAPSTTWPIWQHYGTIIHFKVRFKRVIRSSSIFP